MPDFMNILLEQRKKLQAELDEILEKPGKENRGLSEEESTRFDGVAAQIKDNDEQRAKLEETEKRQKAADEAAAKYSPEVRVKHEPMTYDRNNGNSYFLDLTRSHISNDNEARARLNRHAQEMEVELPKREARRESIAYEEMRSLDAGERRSSFERRVNPNRTDGQGGYFVPPLWLIDEYAPLARAGRPFANSVRNMTLPEGTDSINVPKIATGSSTAAQTADAGGVSSTDLTDTFASAPVRTIAGQQDVALQLIEQSPGAFDEIVFTDLLADYNMRVDIQTLSGTGSSGQLQGIDGLSGTNSVTYTDASPTGPELYTPLAQGASQVAGNRLLPITAYFMHTRRWYWLASQLDSSNRPLVVPEDNGPFNALALQQGLAAEGPVGRTLGAPIIMDANIRTNAGGGTEDRIYAVRTSDLILWEGNLRTRVLTEVLSGTLQVRLQVYNYVAFMPDRYPKSIAVIAGTGLAAPSGF